MAKVTFRDGMLEEYRRYPQLRGEVESIRYILDWYYKPSWWRRLLRFLVRR